MLKEIWNYLHIKCSAAQVIDYFCSIYKATIFSAEQMIQLRNEASRFVESTFEM